MRWLTEYRDELTPDQEAVAADAQAPAPDAQTLHIGPDGTIAGEEPAAAAARRPRARAAHIEGFMQLLREGTVRLRAHGLVIRHPVTVSLKDVQEGGRGWATCRTRSGGRGGCGIPSRACSGARTRPSGSGSSSRKRARTCSG